MRTSIVYMALFAGVLCMSTASIMIRCCTAPAMVIAFYRVMFTAGLAFIFKGFNLNQAISEISRRDLFYMGWAGLFLALHFGFWITSLDFTSVSSSVLFTNLQVIFVLVFSIIFLKEKPAGWVIGGIIIALTGCILIAQGDLQRGKLAGDMLALLSGLFVAIYYLISRNIRARVDTFTYTSLVSGMAALLLFIGSAAAGLGFVGYHMMDWVWFILLGLVPGIGGHAVLNWALKYVKAPLVAVSILGESVGASILAYIFFHEILLWYQIIGGILILAGIYIAAANERKSALVNQTGE